MASGAGSARNAGCLSGRMSQSSQYFHTASPPTVFSFKSIPVLADASCPTPQHWGSSVSWLTVSMWQSSLKWKRSRKLGVCASFTRLGFQPFLNVCQRLRLWTKAFETMPDSAASGRGAFWWIQRRIEALLVEFQQSLVTQRGKKKCQQECWVRDSQQMIRLQKTTNVLWIWVQLWWHQVLQCGLAQSVLAHVLFVTQFQSDLSDFCRQFLSACSYFRNAPVKKSNFVFKKKKCNEEDTNSSKQTVWLMDDLERAPCSHYWLA